MADRVDEEGSPPQKKKHADDPAGDPQHDGPEHDDACVVIGQGQDSKQSIDHHSEVLRIASTARSSSVSRPP